LHGSPSRWVLGAGLPALQLNRTVMAYELSNIAATFNLQK
jgi:hypothetical protein